jgi:hypothetical protein
VNFKYELITGPIFLTMFFNPNRTVLKDDLQLPSRPTFRGDMLYILMTILNIE